MDYPHQLIADCLTAQGLDGASAMRAADAIMAVQIAAGIVDPHRLGKVDRAARIYKMRGQRFTVLAISTRFGVTPKTVFHEIREHLHRQRAVMRVVA